MKKNESIKLINNLSTNYRNLNLTTSMENAWHDVLQYYDYEEVNSKLINCMSEDKFQYQPPTVYYLVSGLTKVEDKLDYSKDILYCKICNRGFNSREELDKHFDRCSSVRYVVRKYKKFFKKDIDMKMLYEMNDEEFKEKYDKLVKYIMNNTKDEFEKKRLGYYFNPPSEKEALKFLNGEG